MRLHFADTHPLMLFEATTEWQDLTTSVMPPHIPAFPRSFHPAGVRSILSHTDPSCPHRDGSKALGLAPLAGGCARAGRPRSTSNSMARSIGIRIIPAGRGLPTQL